MLEVMNPWEKLDQLEQGAHAQKSPRPLKTTEDRDCQGWARGLGHILFANLDRQQNDLETLVGLNLVGKKLGARGYKKEGVVLCTFYSFWILRYL